MVGSSRPRVNPRPIFPLRPGQSREVGRERKRRHSENIGAGRAREGKDRRKKRSEGIRQRKKKPIRNGRKSLKGKKKSRERRQRIRKPEGEKRSAETQRDGEQTPREGQRPREGDWDSGKPETCTLQGTREGERNPESRTETRKWGGSRDVGGEGQKPRARGGDRAGAWREARAGADRE